MNKMLKRTAALFLALAMAVCLAGCKKEEYVMTELDLAKQREIIGFWAAGDKTGYNEYDENGYITSVTVVEFTEDFYQRTHTVDFTSGIVYSYSPVKYSIKDGDFTTLDEKGLEIRAKVGFGKDEEDDVLVWTANGKKDIFYKLSEERAKEFGIVPYVSGQ